VEATSKQPEKIKRNDWLATNRSIPEALAIPHCLVSSTTSLLSVCIPVFSNIAKKKKSIPVFREAPADEDYYRSIESKPFFRGLFVIPSFKTPPMS
jgi:hypothetical protein